MRKAVAVAIAALMISIAYGIPASASVGREAATMLLDAARSRELTIPAGALGSTARLAWPGVAGIVTQLGGPWASLALTGTMLAVDPPTGEALLNSTVATAAVVELMKIGFGRARPFVSGENGRFTGLTLFDSYHSMPSGHTANAFSMATVLAKRYPEWTVPLYAIAAAVGVSRVELGVHWPSDVVVGGVVGAFIGNEVSEGRLRIFKFDR